MYDDVQCTYQGSMADPKQSPGLIDFACSKCDFTAAVTRQGLGKGVYAYIHTIVSDSNIFAEDRQYKAVMKPSARQEYSSSEQDCVIEMAWACTMKEWANMVVDRPQRADRAGVVTYLTRATLKHAGAEWLRLHVSV
jgi:hypothetical protein